MIFGYQNVLKVLLALNVGQDQKPKSAFIADGVRQGIIGHSSVVAEATLHWSYKLHGAPPTDQSIQKDPYWQAKCNKILIQIPGTFKMSSY